MDQEISVERELARAFKMPTALLGVPTEALGPLRCKDPEVEMGAAAVVVFLQSGDAPHQRLELGELRHRVPLPRPELNRGRPGGSKTVEHGHVAPAGGTKRCVEIVEGSVHPLAEGPPPRAHSAEPVAVGALRELLRPLGIVDKRRSIDRVEVRPSEEQVAVFRGTLNQAIDQEQIGRRTLTDRLDILLVPQRERDVTRQAPRR
jgi:hypothetical protein